MSKQTSIRKFLLMLGGADPKPEKSQPSPTKTRTGLFPAEKKPQLRAPDQKLISKVTADRLARKANRDDEFDEEEQIEDLLTPKDCSNIESGPDSVAIPVDAGCSRKVSQSRPNTAPHGRFQLPSSRHARPVANRCTDIISDEEKDSLIGCPTPATFSQADQSEPVAEDAPESTTTPPPTTTSTKTSSSHVRPSSSSSSFSNVRKSVQTTPRLPISRPAVHQPQPIHHPHPYPHSHTPLMHPGSGIMNAYQYSPGIFGHIQQHPSATIVYTNGPLPPSTTSIILVPMAPQNSYFLPPSSPAVTHPPSVTHSLPSQTSDLSVDIASPILLCIDRNVHKPWFDEQIPCLKQMKVKRYKTVETFLHFLDKYTRKKIPRLKLHMLIRVTDVDKLVEEMTKKAPICLKAFRGIYVYERCFAGGSTKSVKQVSESISAMDNVSFSPSLEDAFNLACSAIELEKSTKIENSGMNQQQA